MVNRQKIIIAIGLIAAITATFFMFRFNNMLVKKVPVVVVTSNIMPLDVLSSQVNIRIEKIPPMYVLADAATTIEQVEGKIAKMRLYPGEQIILDKLNPDKKVPLPGEKYLQLPVKGIIIKPGEKVDVWVEYIPGKSQFIGAEKILTDKTVVASLDGQGKSLFNPATGLPSQGVSAQASIEIIVNDADIKRFIEKTSVAKQVIIRNNNPADNMTLDEINYIDETIYTQLEDDKGPNKRDTKTGLEIVEEGVEDN